ncbi:MAG TPA: DUF4407 domain-containing protein [Chryseosolibacter sp.]
MKKLTSFFLLCSGADSALLEKCPTETSKYAGMGATIFFTGVFAALAAGYALYTVFDSVIAASVFGLVWGLMIFNLDRYIVSSMRKDGGWREFMTAAPRVILAVIISIVIARPLELKIFEKEINPELIVMEQETYARQESQLKARFTQPLDSMKAERARLKQEIVAKTLSRDALVRIAQEEADGTGGSRKRNLGPIYKVKKADADKAEVEMQQLLQTNQARIGELERASADIERAMSSEIAAMEKSKMDGPAARMEALDRLTKSSSAMWWANVFIVLLFIAIETSPIFVKLISGKGPYDNLLRIEEHKFFAQEVEEVAKTNGGIKERSGTLPQHERGYISDKLNSALK